MTFFYVLVVLMSVVAVGTAGYTNFMCPTEGNSSLIIPCNHDCKITHGAVGGVCGDARAGDYNCYCDGRVMSPERSTLQCLEMTDAYRNICTHDCICNHGADGGHCNWDLGVCYCEAWGHNPKNVGCPAKTIDEWRAVSRDILGSDKI